MMVISVDRWSAIIHPLEHNANPRRTKIMLVMAWLLALVFSIPNSVMHLRTGILECRYIFSNLDQMQLLNTILWMALSFLLPLITMFVCHTSMIVHLYRRSKTTGAGWLAEAKLKTVKITSILVLGFVICWMPLVVMILWSLIDQTSAEDAQELWYHIQHFGCVNNCLNPLFYGMVGKKWISWKKFFGKRKKQDLTKKTTQTSDTRSSFV